MLKTLRACVHACIISEPCACSCARPFCAACWGAALASGAASPTTAGGRSSCCSAIERSSSWSANAAASATGPSWSCASASSRCASLRGRRRRLACGASGCGSRAPWQSSEAVSCLRRGGHGWTLQMCAISIFVVFEVARYGSAFPVCRNGGARRLCMNMACRTA